MKRNRDEYKKLIIFTEVIVLFAIFTFLFAGVWYQRMVPVIEIGLFRRGHWAVIGFYALLFLVFAKMFGGFKLAVARKTDMCFSYIANIIFTNIIIYFVTVAFTLDYGIWNYYGILAGTEVIIFIFWMLAVVIINNILFPPHNMLLIHGDYSQKDVILKVNRRQDRYSIKESINIEDGFARIKERMESYDSVIISDVPAEERNDILKYCYENNKRAYMLPKITDIIIRSADEIHIFDTPVLLSKNYGLSFEQKVIKRFMDILVSGTGIVICTIPMLIIAALIKWEDGGTVLFRQDRLTKNGKVFKICKFRSMSVDAEERGAQLAKKDDERITRVGAVLRRLHLDELPQLFNVFKGSMSMVGPRPERPEIMKEYSEKIPEFNFRLKVKGGLTGYAQVYGKYNTTPYNKLRLDLTYIQNYSIFLDIKIMIVTIKVLFKKETSEGVDRNQTTALK